MSDEEGSMHQALRKADPSDALRDQATPLSPVITLRLRSLPQIFGAP